MCYWPDIEEEIAKSHYLYTMFFKLSTKSGDTLLSVARYT